MLRYPGDISGSDTITPEEAVVIVPKLQKHVDKSRKRRDYYKQKCVRLGKKVKNLEELVEQLQRNSMVSGDGYAHLQV